MRAVNEANDALNQYADDRNLSARVALHQRFSTNKLGWTNWVFARLDLKSGQRALELGCGNAALWKANAGRLPVGLDLTLTDFSPGMLATAKEATAGMAGIAYALADAQAIPFPGGAFDVVIANHMLYHVPDLDRALAEIARVLRPDGVLYATTIGRNNMRELGALLRGFDARIDFAQDLVTEAFGLENGVEKLRAFFHEARAERYDDSLHITEPHALVEYVHSARGIGNACEVIGENAAAFEEYVRGLFADSGFMDIQKDAGMLIASQPKT